jgi:hypothetical protein
VPKGRSGLMACGFLAGKASIIDSPYSSMTG